MSLERAPETRSCVKHNLPYCVQFLMLGSNEHLLPSGASESQSINDTQHPKRPNTEPDGALA